MGSVTFASTGGMSVGRVFHTATLLGNGKVLVVGGATDRCPSLGPLSSAELYDPATGKWTTTGGLKSGRCGCAATLLRDGRVLVVGGAGSSAEVYDPATGKWTATGSTSTAHGHDPTTLLRDGRVLVSGGSSELYDPTAGLWSPTGGMVAADRSNHAATLLRDGKVLAAGGLVNGGPSSSAELYDPATGKWSATGSMNAPRNEPAATLLSNGRVLVVGGTDTGSAELYDPSSGRWTPTGEMNHARGQFTATLLTDGKVLVVGGATVVGSKDGIQSFTFFPSELYEPAPGAWADAGDRIVARAGHTATLLDNGKVLLAGGSRTGYTGEESALSSAELVTYVPATH